MSVVFEHVGASSRTSRRIRQTHSQKPVRPLPKKPAPTPPYFNQRPDILYTVYRQNLQSAARRALKTTYNYDIAYGGPEVPAQLIGKILAMHKAKRMCTMPAPNLSLDGCDETHPGVDAGFIAVTDQQTLNAGTAGVLQISEHVIIATDKTNQNDIVGMIALSTNRPGQLYIDLLCAAARTGMGTPLMRLAENFAFTSNIPLMTLSALPYTQDDYDTCMNAPLGGSGSLLSYYNENHGYEVTENGCAIRKKPIDWRSLPELYDKGVPMSKCIRPKAKRR